MRLYLLRHGTAEETPPGLSDNARALTPGGVDDVRALGRELARRGETLDAILCSSLVRAVQTAQIISEAIGFRGPLRVLADLIPGGHPIDAVELARTSGVESVLLVGHEPQMSAMSAYALGRPDAAPFQPGMLLAVDLPESGKGTLRFGLLRDRPVDPLR